MTRHAAGFTLIELLVAVAILGILVTVAAVSYQEHVMRSARADAKAVLMETAGWLERFYTTNGRYNNADDSLPQLPFPRVPKGAAVGAQRFDITVNVPAGGQSYTLSAAPVNAQAGDACGTLTLTNTGVMGVTGAGATVAECWQR